MKEQMKNKIIYLQDWSRRNSLRVDDIKKRSNETLEDCENELPTLFKESVGIKKEVVIERAHRVKTDQSKKSNTPRTIAEF